jgi:hypothetical protein
MVVEESLAQSRRWTPEDEDEDDDEFKPLSERGQARGRTSPPARALCPGWRATVAARHLERATQSTYDALCGHLSCRGRVRGGETRPDENPSCHSAADKDRACQRADSSSRSSSSTSASRDDPSSSMRTREASKSWTVRATTHEAGPSKSWMLASRSRAVAHSLTGSLGHTLSAREHG